MKKYYQLLSLLLFIYNICWSQTITVLSPNGGEQIQSETQYTISWEENNTSSYTDVDFSTLGTPTVTGVSPSSIDNNSNAVTVSGTNFAAGILVHAQNADGDVFVPTAISVTNATTVVATFDIDTDGTYFIRVENTDGFAAISSSAILTVS